MINWLLKLLGGKIMFDNISAEAFKKEMEQHPDAVVIDVRTPGEYNSGKLKKAVNIDYHSPDFKNRISKLDQSKRYLVYCRSGARSFNACNIMANSGFNSVANMKGGIMSWRGETD